MPSSFAFFISREVPTAACSALAEHQAVAVSPVRIRVWDRRQPRGRPSRAVYETRPLSSVNECIDEVLDGRVKARIVFDM
ncbi:hypothetical protein V1460_10255 [Streptomyces sp. SCSIO 30461]|uniref:hypothetical protein n=1 Tax=Streptomyces sp. SCSIO 30461 TaxID=3118085 RepID=UPI0030D5C739